MRPCELPCLGAVPSCGTESKVKLVTILVKIGGTRQHYATISPYQISPERTTRTALLLQLCGTCRAIGMKAVWQGYL